MRHSGPIITLLAAALITAPEVSSSARAADPAPKLVAEHFMIDAIDPGIKLYVRNKRPEQLKQFTSEKTLLFVHGATQPAEATFDLPLEGLSWMDYIAQRGWDVYLVDVRAMGDRRAHQRWISRLRTILPSLRLMWRSRTLAQQSTSSCVGEVCRNSVSWVGHGGP
jgi:alpha-beta hydrolase superfamily lysophospholipase